jgi:hypothetical protein
MGDFAEYFSGEPNFDIQASGVNRPWYSHHIETNKPINDSKTDTLELGKPIIGDNSLTDSLTLPVNNSYNILKKPHPSDTTAMMLKQDKDKAKSDISTRKKEGKKFEKKDNTISKEIKMIELKNEKCTNKDYPYYKNYLGSSYCTKKNIGIQDSIDNKEFCYLDNNIHPDLVNYYGKIGINACNSQMNIASQPTQPTKIRTYQNQQPIVSRNVYPTQPINIYMSCSNNSTEQGYDMDIHEKCLNKKGKVYKDTLYSWYNDQSSGDSSYLRRRKWRDIHINNRDFYKYPDNPNMRPNMSLTKPDLHYQESTIGGNIQNGKMEGVKGYNFNE